MTSKVKYEKTKLADNPKTSTSDILSQSTYPEHKYLSEKSLPLHGSISGRDRPAVPPMSPKDLIFDYSYTRVPKSFPKLDNFKLPYIREVGVKSCMDNLADYFHCTDYKCNLIQFWFLDIMTDCLWRAQDEYQFHEQQQKIILEWILYIFNLIRAPEYNLSRKQLFRLFKEAMLVAEEYIQTGCRDVPLPQELFTLNLEENKEENSIDLESEVSSSNESTISVESSPQKGSYLAMHFEGNTECFKLPEKTCPWNIEEECDSSSEETMSEEDKPRPSVESQEAKDMYGDFLPESEEIEFYKPDLSTPPRFRPSHTSIIESVSISLDEDSEKISEESGDAAWMDIPRHPRGVRCPSKLKVDIKPANIRYSETSNKMSKTSDTIHYDDESILKIWKQYYLWKQRESDMNDPNIGWATYSDTGVIDPSTIPRDTKKIDEIKREWINYLNDEKYEMKAMDENIFINTCVLLAIKQFVFDYFYETFQYTLIRIAFRYSHNLITQEVSDEWCVPKVLKSELKRPKPTKPKKEKKKKEKKPKKEKKDKKSKSSKDKSSKKGKSPKDKEKKAKKDKPKPLTKEEKAELARLKKEQDRLEAERRIAEEHRRFMFPLTEAATDVFFHGIFENWKRPEKGKKKAKEKNI